MVVVVVVVVVVVDVVVVDVLIVVELVAVVIEDSEVILKNDGNTLIDEKILMMRSNKVEIGEDLQQMGDMLIPNTDKNTYKGEDSEIMLFLNNFSIDFFISIKPGLCCPHLTQGIMLVSSISTGFILQAPTLYVMSITSSLLVFHIILS